MSLAHALFVGRWSMLLLVLPYTLVLTRAPGTGGSLAAIALGFAVLYYFACVDRRVAANSGQLRLAMRRDRALVNEDVFSLAKVLFGAAAAVLALLLLAFVRWPVGLTLLAALGVIALLDAISDRWPMRLVELALPAAMLGLPYVLLRWFASPLLDHGGYAVLTLTGGLLMAGYVLLCLMRDVRLDAGERRVTTATTLGPDGALAVFVLYAGGAMALLIGYGAGWGLGAAAVLPLAGMIVVWLASIGWTGYAVGLWYLAAAVAAIVLNLATIR